MNILIKMKEICFTPVRYLRLDSVSLRWDCISVT
jgi:hypothetical protein